MENMEKNFFKFAEGELSKNQGNNDLLALHLFNDNETIMPLSYATVIDVVNVLKEGDKSNSISKRSEEFHTNLIENEVNTFDNLDNVDFIPEQRADLDYYYKLFESN